MCHAIKDKPEANAIQMWIVDVATMARMAYGFDSNYAYAMVEGSCRTMVEELEYDGSSGESCPERVSGTRIDKRRLEAVDRKRRSDKDEARSTSHLLAHSPKNIYCIACRQAKVTNVRFNRKEREFVSEAKAFGDRVTADTIPLKGTRDRGVQGETNAVVFFDLATGWIDCIPVKSRHTDETVRAITQFQGPESYIKQLYTDQAPEFDKACGKVGTCNATSTPGMPRTNGIAECKVKEVIRGARVLLRQAGLEAKWWPYAVRAHCFHQNCDGRDGPSAYEKRYGEKMDEVDLRPFGCLVDYLPIAPKPRRAQRRIEGTRAEEDDEALALEADEDESSVAALVAGTGGENSGRKEGESEQEELDAALPRKLSLIPLRRPAFTPNGDYRVIEFSHLLHAWSEPSVHQIKRVVSEEGGGWYFPMQRVYESRTRMMGEARARAIADIEMRRESQGIELGETFDVGRELREDTKRHIEDDRRFLESGDYWEHFEDEREWVLHHLSRRFKLCGPTEEQKAGDGPGERNLDPMRFTRLEYRNGEVEEIWDNRFSGRSRTNRKWVGFSAYWEEGYAPGAPEERTKRAPGTPRTRRLIGLDYEQDMPRVERPYANSGKPNSILSEDWRDLSCNQREAHLEHDKRRILERASKTRTEHERAIEENQESWRNVGNRTWIARSYIAPRPDGVPEHFRVSRYDADASTMKGTTRHKTILHRVTRHADSREEIMSEPIPAGTEREDPGVMARKLVRPQDIITELWYEPEVTEPAAERTQDGWRGLA